MDSASPTRPRRDRCRRRTRWARPRADRDPTDDTAAERPIARGRRWNPLPGHEQTEDTGPDLVSLFDFVANLAGDRSQRSAAARHQLRKASGGF